MVSIPQFKVWWDTKSFIFSHFTSSRIIFEGRGNLDVSNSILSSMSDLFTWPWNHCFPECFWTCYFFCFVFFLATTQLEGSLNTSRKWKCGVLTTGLPGKSQSLVFFEARVNSFIFQKIPTKYRVKGIMVCLSVVLPNKNCVL